MGIQHTIKCPLCGEEITSLIEPGRKRNVDQHEVEKLMLAAHICKDRKLHPERKEI